MFKTVDMLWSLIISETKYLLKKEPLLFKLYYKYILQYTNFQDSITGIILHKLKNSIIPCSMLYKVCNESFDVNPMMIDSMSRDLQAIRNRDPSVQEYITPLLYFKGFHALQVYRLAHHLWNSRQRSLSLYLQNQVSTLFSVDIHPASKIGSGIMFDHATGIVIGETVIIDNNVSIFQSVTLGGTGKNIGDRHPKIRSDVIIGAGAKILGNIEIGVGAKIGAGSVVLDSVPAYSTAAGVPAKIVNIANKKKFYKNNENIISHFLNLDYKYEHGAGI